jgi:cytochrome P450
MLLECERRFGEAFTLIFPGYGPQVFFTNPEAIKQIFTGDPEDLRAGESNAVIEPLVGKNSLLLLDGRRHLLERKLMLPPFHGERMQAYGETMQEIAREVINSWPVGRQFALQDQMQAIAIDVILRTVFGLDRGPEMSLLRTKLQEMLAVGANPMWLMPWFQIDLGRLTPWGRMVDLKKEITGLIYAEIDKRRRSGTKDRVDVLSMLLEARDDDGRTLSDEELRDEMVTLLVAGHETTTTSLSWAVYHLQRNLGELALLKEEITRVTQGGPVRLEHLAKLERVDGAVKETLRLTPVVPVVGRVLHRSMEIGGWPLPKGAYVIPCAYLTHRRPDVWRDPERFNPGRFIDARPSPYELLPFGGGVRRCIGMAFAMYEMKVVLSELVSRTTLRLAPGYEARIAHRGITFAPSDGVPVIIEKRNLA